MEKLEKRRRNPLAKVAVLVVLVLLVIECGVMFGVYELQGKTVAKYAPWAYEPFLRLVGEHPDSTPRGAAIEEEKKRYRPVSAVADLGGIAPTAFESMIDTNAPLATNVILEASIPIETDVEPEPVTTLPESTPAEVEEAVPVG